MVLRWRCYFARRPSLILYFNADFHGHHDRCTISLEIGVSTKLKMKLTEKIYIMMMKWRMVELAEMAAFQPTPTPFSHFFLSFHFSGILNCTRSSCLMLVCYFFFFVFVPNNIIIIAVVVPFRLYAFG